MEKVIPTFYAEYGRYISRFRMIPLNIDCLLPVERRTLLILNRFGSTKSTKSLKIDGCVIGELHPHGSIYPTLVNLVRNGFASEEDSSWGGIGLIDSPPTAPRYSETRILPWVSKFAFEFINYVPWKMLELDNEPLYLPSILPLGLIGDGVINGIAFHRTIIPKYTKEDLAKRLKWLIQNGGKPDVPKNFNSNLTEDKYGPLIKPYKKDCELKEVNKNDFYKLLLTGEGDILYQPHVQTKSIDVERNGKKQKITVISIEGRAPNASFESLLKAYEKNTIPLSSPPTDLSKKMNICIYLEIKKGIDCDKFIKQLSNKYLNKTIHFKCYMCDLNGVVEITSIDDLLLNCYHHWKNAYYEKLSGDIEKLNTKLIEYFICSFIREKLNLNINNIHDILRLWQNNEIDLFKINADRKIITYKYKISNEDIEKIYYSSPIRKLIEYKTTYDEIKNKLDLIQNELINLDNIGLSRIDNIIQG